MKILKCKQQRIGWRLEPPKKEKKCGIEKNCTQHTKQKKLDAFIIINASFLVDLIFKA